MSGPRQRLRRRLTDGSQIILRCPNGVKRLHQLDRCAVDLRQLTRPDLLIEAFQVGLIVSGQHALAAIVHDAERLVLAKYLTRPRGFAEIGEKVPQSDNVTNFVDESFHLVLPDLREHPGVERQLVTAGVGKEGARQHASTGIAVVVLPHHDLEVRNGGALGEFNRAASPHANRASLAASESLPWPPSGA